ncbi:MAG: hypothetical protein LUI12_01795 [Clostridiales bacterium]|nr:hypothetical protein [Clostridiales bacterium]
MQSASRAYRKSLKQIGRNRGYIKITIGIYNSEAQKNIKINETTTVMTYFSSVQNIFDGTLPEKIYATCEQDFSKINGNMYFLPKKSSESSYYYNGVVLEDFYSAIYIDFNGLSGFDIKGLTINFGEYYPVDFSIENDEGIHYYTDNDQSVFITEDTFNETSFFIITPTKMINENMRLRLYQFSCGITNTFTNKETMNYSSTEYVSSISETVPSQDVSITIYNENQYYNPDNPDSALSYMEIGQEVNVSFGYDAIGDGNIEWLPAQTSYLKSWEADQLEATFTSTDRFDNMSGTYYKGLYHAEGISLYDLAVDVFEDAGISDYYLDEYLKDVLVKNPIPVVSHSEALQIIANAGRCSLSEDRNNRVHLQTSFIPEMTVSVDAQTEYSHAEDILNGKEKSAYAEMSNDFSKVDNSLFFMTKDQDYLATGYISEAIADEDGTFTENPKITINLEATYVPYGITIEFRNIAPQEFEIVTYNGGIGVGEYYISNPDVIYTTNESFSAFDEMEIIFTKGYPNSRIFVDNIIFGDATDYTLEKNTELKSLPKATRQTKIKSINVTRNIYNLGDSLKVLASEELDISEDGYEHTVYFSNPTHDLSVTLGEVQPTGYISATDLTEITQQTVQELYESLGTESVSEVSEVEEETEEDSGTEVTSESDVTAEIIESSCYYAVIRFSGISEETTIKYSITGYEYSITEQEYSVEHNTQGEIKKWNNPLVSDNEHAADLEEWLSSYFLGDVEYEIDWRGDPRVDANDIFILETSVGMTTVRAYETTLNFSGSWSGSMKARKAVF